VVFRVLGKKIKIVTSPCGHSAVKVTTLNHCKWRILEAFKIFFPMPFLSTVSITEENYMPRKLKYSSF
jgi:hypothetical protein